MERISNLKVRNTVVFNYSKIFTGPLAWLIPLLLLAIIQPNICFSEDNMLGDSGFELSTANGSFPDSGYWVSSHAPLTAGAVVTTTAAHSGNNGLWAYTGTESGAYWTGPYQELSAYPGDIFIAQAWCRTPSGQSWLAGSKALVRVKFLNGSTVLGQYDSNAVTNANSGWQLLTLTTPPAPQNTTFVRFVLYLEKPQSSGQSIANFDDGSLILQPSIDCDPNDDGQVNMKDVLSVLKDCKNDSGDTKTCIGEAKTFITECLL